MSRLREALDKLEEAKTMLAEAIKTELDPEPLKIEKIAVRVSNEREFKFLMQHYESLGWKPDRTVGNFDIDKHEAIDYHDNYFWDTAVLQKEKYGYKIIDFDFFCAQKGLTPPKTYPTTDGKFIGHDDEYFSVDTDFEITRYVLCSTPNGGNIFSTKEAAEKWIEEKNKPKEIHIKMESLGNAAAVDLNGVRFFFQGNRALSINSEELKKIYYAWTKINAGK